MKTNATLSNLRRQLSYLDALPQLTILGTLSGVAAALVIIAFRLAMNGPLENWLGQVDNFERLSDLERFLLPTIGALLIGLGLQWLPTRLLRVGVTHVLDRVHNFQSHLPWPNFLVQFIAGTALMISGQSVGREGPAVHLGAGAASLVGQWLKIPNNSLRVLVAAGVAAAISAAFNTPLAGVVFAMEVVLMEYTITGFIPIIIAAFAGSLLSRLVFGTDPVFTVQTVQLATLTELPYMLIAGLLIGGVAVLYSHSLTLGRFVGKVPIAIRITVAGAITGLLAIEVPQILGMGYDTLAQAMHGQIAVHLLLVIIVVKLAATGISLSAGMPGGLIGPTLFLGGLVGALLSHGGLLLFGDQASNTGFYVLLGMAAMFGAVLNAPLTALITILELTNNPNIIFPCMLVVVIACLCTRAFTGDKGIFQILLRQQGKTIKSSGLTSELSRAGVFQVLSTDFARCSFEIDYEQAVKVLESKPQWLVLQELNKDKYLMRAAELAKFLENASDSIKAGEKLIELMEVPGNKTKLPPIHEQASLLEVHWLMKSESTEAVYVQNPRQLALEAEVMGIITREALTNYYSI